MSLQQERLRSPRGSPRNGNNTDSCIYSLISRRDRLWIILGLVLCAIFASINFRPWNDDYGSTALAGSVSGRGVMSSNLYHDMPSDLVPFESVTGSFPSKSINDDERGPEDLTVASRSVSFTDTDFKDGNKLLQSYNASLHPVLHTLEYKPSKSNPLQVHVLVDVTLSISPSSKSIVDGLERSEYVKVVGITYVELHKIKTVQVHPEDYSKPAVWVVDWESLNRDCHLLERALFKQRQRQQENKQDFYVVLIDFSGSTRQTTCHSSNSSSYVIPKKQIRLVKRSIVQNRYYYKKSIHVGEVLPNEGEESSAGPVLHAPLPLREQFVEFVRNVSSKPFTALRSTDVAFYWGVRDVSNYELWREFIAKMVKSLKDSPQNKTNGIDSSEIKVQFIENNGLEMEEGGVQMDYVNQLLSTKIVILAQRDEWEDHFLLMEALASGALVVTDRMITLPAGLSDQSNILVYEDAQSLKRIVRDYLDPKNEKKRLDIAKQGWKVAMSRHRSWHRIEEVLFGRPLTQVDRPYDPSPVKKTAKSSTSVTLTSTAEAFL